MSRRHGGIPSRVMVACYGFGRRDISDPFRKPPADGPVDPFKGRELDRLEAASRLLAASHFGLEQVGDASGRRALS